MRGFKQFLKTFKVRLFNLILKKNYINFNYLNAFLGCKNYLKAS